MNFLLGLDVLSFNDLAEIAMRVHNRREIERATTMRVAMNADQKQWKEWSKHYVEDKAVTTSDAKDLMRLLNSGKLK